MSAAQTLEDRLLLAAQVLTPTPQSINASANSSFSFDLNYSEIDAENLSPDALIAQVHFNSNQVSFNASTGVTNLFDDGLDTSVVMEDVNDGDQDSNTDRFFKLIWSDRNDWPPNDQTLPLRLLTMTLQTGAGFSGTQLNFSGEADVGDGFKLQVASSVIVDLSVIPGISITDAATVAEGNNATFDVTLSADPATPVEVTYSTQNGTASTPDDFTARAGETLTFHPGGPRTQQIVVATIDDDRVELDESFSVTIATAAEQATVTRGTADATITSDDLPKLSVSDAADVEEGEPAVFTIEVDQALLVPVTVTYSTSDGTATAPDDYTALVNQTVTFSPGGPVTQAVSVQTIDTSAIDGNRTFSLQISSAPGATISDNRGDAIIRDNEIPEVSISEAGDVAEGAGAAFNVTLSRDPAAPVTVTYSTKDGSAIAPDDYTALIDQTLVFNPGEPLVQQIIVTTIDDNRVEPNGTFSVTITTAAEQATVTRGTANATITSDDLPKLSVSDAADVEEGESAVFTVELDQAPLTRITVIWSTENGSATAGDDYTAETDNTLTFEPGGSLTQQITVAIIDDQDTEGPETFFVILSSPAVISVAGARGEATINDNDQTFNGDIDGDNTASPLSDGILVLRYMAGFEFDALVNGVVNPNGSRAHIIPLTTYLQFEALPVLDIDGNAHVDALSDGILFLRWLAGFTGEALVTGVIDTNNGHRTDAGEVLAYLDAFRPPEARSHAPKEFSRAARVSNDSILAGSAEQHTNRPHSVRAVELADLGVASATESNRDAGGSSNAESQRETEHGKLPIHDAATFHALLPKLFDDILQVEELLSGV